MSNSAPQIRPVRKLFRRHPGSRAPANAASRISAFVYGNILVTTALVALHPHDLLEPKALAYVAGTGFSTFLAHVLAESVGTRVRTDRRMSLRDLRHELRDSLPIISSATFPLLVMGATLAGWVNPDIALPAALAVTALRLAGLGIVIGRLRQRSPSLRAALSGVLLALFCLGAALLKAWLTH